MTVGALSWDERHARLIERLAREREELGYLVIRAQAPVRRVERVGEKTRYLVHRLSFLGIPVVVLVLLRPRRALKWIAKVWSVYRVVHKIRRLMP